MRGRHGAGSKSMTGLPHHVINLGEFFTLSRNELQLESMPKLIMYY